MGQNVTMLSKISPLHVSGAKTIMTYFMNNSSYPLWWIIFSVDRITCPSVPRLTLWSVSSRHPNLSVFIFTRFFFLFFLKFFLFKSSKSVSVYCLVYFSCSLHNQNHVRPHYCFLPTGGLWHAANGYSNCKSKLEPEQVFQQAATVHKIWRLYVMIQFILS